MLTARVIIQNGNLPDEASISFSGPMLFEKNEPERIKVRMSTIVKKSAAYAASLSCSFRV
jgi:hypothetical protein